MRINRNNKCLFPIKSDFLLKVAKSHLTFIIFVIHLFSYSYVNAMKIPEGFQKAKEIPLTANSKVTSDYLGNLYVYSETTLTRYANDFTSLTYNQPTYGKISFVDASNPLKILVYYQDFGQIVFLNQNLTIIGTPVSINDLGFYDATLVCNSSNDGFWIFDNTQKQLVHINNQMQADRKTGNLNTQNSREFNPKYLCEQNQKLWLSVPEEGIFVLDNWGTFIKKIPLKNIQNFQIRKEIVYFYLNNKLQSYNIKSMEVSDIEIPVSESVTNVLIEDKKIFLISKNKIEIFQVSL